MSFLQPWMLIALPLAALPVIIHLINQRRFQTTQWAAMMFLLTANRMNRGYAKIRQWLILAFRTMVIAALVFAVGRPLVSGTLGGGVFGSVFRQGSSTAIVLVDRSPSMQARAGAAAQTKLDLGLAQIAESLDTMGTERVVLIESNRALPIELASTGGLLDSPHVGPSDASADLPKMLLAALDYINANQLGQTDIWICSDLRAEDWRVDDGRWKSLREAYAEFGRRVRFRLMAMDGTDLVTGTENGNRQIRVEKTALVSEGPDTLVSISLKVQQQAADANGEEDSEGTAKTFLPVTFDLLGNRSTVEVEVRNGVGELTNHRVPLPSGQSRGQGSVSIAADTNGADNTYFFTFDETPPRRCVIVTDDEEVGRVLSLAAEIATDEAMVNIAEVISTSQVGSIRWDETALVLWHASLPEDDAGRADDATAIRSFVDRGGRIVFFPPARQSQQDRSRELFSIAWGDWQQPSGSLAVSTWRSDADILSATLAGASLPLGKLQVSRYASLIGDATPLAKLADGSMLFARVPTRRGGVYFCATTPSREDSSLATDGVVLYVLVQRVLDEGAVSLGNTLQMDAGESDADFAAQWRKLAGDKSALSIDNAFVAGVYAEGEGQKWLAVNRSVAEDSAVIASDVKVDQLFDGLVYDRIAGQAATGRSLVEEAWRAFLMVMLAAMIGEAFLCLPKVSQYSTLESIGGTKRTAANPATEFAGSGAA